MRPAVDSELVNINPNYLSCSVLHASTHQSATICTSVLGAVSGLFVSLHFRSRGAKSPRTFVRWNFRTPGTFAPQERMFQELSFHGTFAPVKRSLHRQLSCPLTFAPVELSLPYLNKLWKAGKQCFHRRMLANVRCCLLVGLCVLRSTVLVQINKYQSYQ